MLFLRGRFPFDSLKKLPTCVGSLVVVVPSRAEDVRDESACHG